MAGGRNHAPLEQLLDEIKFQRRQVDQPQFCLTFDMFQKQERAEKLLPRPRVHHRPQHNILDRPLCSAFPLPGGRSELSNQSLFILLLSLTLQTIRLTYWAFTCKSILLIDQADTAIDSDDLLFFVRKRQASCNFSGKWCAICLLFRLFL